MKIPDDSLDYEAEDLDRDIGSDKLYIMHIHRDKGQITLWVFYNDKGNAIAERRTSPYLTYGQCKEMILELSKDNETWGDLEGIYWPPGTKPSYILYGD